MFSPPVGFILKLMANRLIALGRYHRKSNIWSQLWQSGTTWSMVRVLFTVCNPRENANPVCLTLGRYCCVYLIDECVNWQFIFREPYLSESKYCSVNLFWDNRTPSNKFCIAYRLLFSTTLNLLIFSLNFSIVIILQFFQLNITFHPIFKNQNLKTATFHMQHSPK